MSSNISDFKDTKRQLKKNLNDLEELIAKIDDKLECKFDLWNLKFKKYMFINLIIIFLEESNDKH